MRALCILLVVQLAACATHPARLRCDGRLQPINTPAAAATLSTPAAPPHRGQP